MSEHHNPIDQFKLQKALDLKLFGIDISITNSTIMLFIITGFIILTLFLFSQSKSKIPNGMQVAGEVFYRFIFNLMKSNIQNRTRLRYFPFLFTLFFFVLISNLLGLVPYSFTVTSHLSVTIALAGLVFFTVIVVSIIKKGFFGFISSFVPSGVPVVLIPLIFVIEVFAFISRPCTLAVRLAANMIAGHTMLKVIAGFVSSMGFFGIIPIAFISVLTGFEFFVACLQAYIFAILTCIYLNEALSDSH